MNNVFKVIKEQRDIFKFHRKSQKLKYILRWKNHSNNIFFHVLPSLLGFLGLITFLFMKSETNQFLNDLLIMISGSLLISFCFIWFLNDIFSFLYRKINKVKKESVLIESKYFNRFKKLKNINSIAYKYENSLNEKEKKYYKKESPFATDSEYYYYFKLYKKALNNMSGLEIKKEHELIIENIKEDFDIREQKRLFSEITHILNHKTADKELEELYSVLNKKEKSEDIISQRNQIIKKL